MFARMGYCDLIDAESRASDHFICVFSVVFTEIGLKYHVNTVFNCHFNKNFDDNADCNEYYYQSHGIFVFDVCQFFVATNPCFWFCFAKNW